VRFNHRFLRLGCGSLLAASLGACSPNITRQITGCESYSGVCFHCYTSCAEKKTEIKSQKVLINKEGLTLKGESDG